MRIHLQNEEEGLFVFGTTAEWFIKPDTEEKKCFPGHEFIIFKYQIEGKNRYQLLQSYIGCYTLQYFLKNHLNQFSYDTYEKLEKEFLNPFEKLISNINKTWTQEMDSTYWRQTLIPSQMEGFRPKANIHFEMRRTTNKEEILDWKTRFMRRLLPSTETCIYIIALELFITIKMIKMLRSR